MGGYPFRIEPGHVLTFARAVGDDGLSERIPVPGTPVPMTFTTAAIQFDPDHMRGMHPTGALAATVATAGGSVLLAEQEFEYFAPVRVGDELTVTEYDGQTWRKHSRRAGSLLFREIIRDFHGADAELVLRSRMVLVETEFAVAAEDGQS